MAGESWKESPPVAVCKLATMRVIYVCARVRVHASLTLVFSRIVI